MPNLLRRSLMRASMANSGPAEPKTSTAPVNRQSRSAASPRPPTCGAQPALLRVVAWHPVSVDVSIPNCVGGRAAGLLTLVRSCRSKTPPCCRHHPQPCRRSATRPGCARWATPALPRASTFPAPGAGFARPPGRCLRPARRLPEAHHHLQLHVRPPEHFVARQRMALARLPARHARQQHHPSADVRPERLAPLAAYSGQRGQHSGGKASPFWLKGVTVLAERGQHSEGKESPRSEATLAGSSMP